MVASLPRKMANYESKPLVLDVDGTFLRTDLLMENFWAALGQAPLRAIGLGVRHASQPARLKAELADLAQMRIDLMPVNPEIKEMALAAQAEGREVVLASASHAPFVAEVARAHGLTGATYGSDGQSNLKGSAKARALVAAYGEGGFDYAGDAGVDAKVWAHAHGAIIVGKQPAARAELEQAGKSIVEIDGGWAWRDLIRAWRPHQWVKNVLLLLPMIAAHDFSLGTLLPVLLGIAAFSAAASSIYIVNDLLDLEADRLHETKCRRPFASGAVPILVGMLSFVGLAVFALGLAAVLNLAFAGVVALYMVLSLAYSLKLKRMRWVDIATLAGLYTLRVVAGAAAGSVLISAHILIFIFPIFLTLGCVKRLTELSKAKDDNRLPGRGYGRLDRPDLLNVSGLGVCGALLIFFLYSFSDQGIALYKTPWLLWATLPFIAFWLIRMVRLGWLGKMDYDPVVFALRDKIGIGILCFTLSIMFYAAGLWARWMGL